MKNRSNGSRVATGAQRHGRMERFYSVLSKRCECT